MIIVLYGTDTYRSSQKLKGLKEKFVREVDPSGLNLIELDGENITVDAFHSAVSSVSFLARKRMVIVTDLITKNKAQTISKDIAEALSDDLGDDTIIIFWESKPNGNNSLLKFLKKQKFVYEFSFLDQRDVQHWIVQRIKELGGSIETSAVLMLSEYLGSDLHIVENEIQELIAYGRHRSIGPHDVEQMVHSQFDNIVFHFIDALCARDARRAYRLLNDQFSSGAHELYLLTMLIRQFRILLMLKDFQDAHGMVNHGELSSVAKKLSLHPYVVKKSLGQSAKFDIAELKRIYFQLMKIDEALKTSGGNSRVHFDLLLAKIV